MFCAHVQSALRIKRIISAAWSSRHKLGWMDKLVQVGGSDMTTHTESVCSSCLNSKGTLERKSVWGRIFRAGNRSCKP